MNKGYVNRSQLAPYIQDFISTKRAVGFKYVAEEKTLANFDNFCIMNNLDDGELIQKLVSLWSVQKPGEDLNSRNARVSCIRQFALFLAALGVNAYIPKTLYSGEKHVPHIPSEEELAEFFSVVDQYSPKNNGQCYQRLRLIYPILFRLLYCCGLRLSEACYLGCEQFDLSSGRITLLHSKGDKDRIVYTSDDFLALCRKYDKTVRCFIKSREWFFPGYNIYQPIQKTSVDKKFQEFWVKTSFAGNVEKRPTPHCLRHAFCCHRMRKWLEEGKDLEVMMPYLSKYMGHASIEGTHYYYHQIKSIFPTILKRDSTSQKIIPEVKSYE